MEAYVKERPILFSGPMINAILSGAKTQTRRVIKPQPTINLDWVTEWGWTFFTPEKHISGRIKNPAMEPREIFLPCPYALGQRLWVREAHTYAEVGYDSELNMSTVRVDYRADDSMTICHVDEEIADGIETWISDREVDGDGDNWRPSIHMPRWASRITLEVTGVKVERVSDISHDDALAEGVVAWHDTVDGTVWTPEFHLLWDSINGKRPGCSWAESPWVWVISFRRITP